MRRLVPVLVLVALCPAAVAATTFGHGNVRVEPAVGSPTTDFRAGFTTPERTGAHGSIERHDLLAASVPGHHTGCVESIDVQTPNGPAGARIHLTLRPGPSGAHWCTGTYTGEIEEVQTARCPKAELCPTYVLVRGLVGRFKFQVTSRDISAPRFAGLDHAFACTPGPQRPGQTTPYTLSWKPATDDHTPGSEIVYDVYYATRPGGENFRAPSWTAPPGSTSFRTPGLPSHGQAYFVVRARDRAGNEDRNTVERQGLDPCL